MKLNKNRRRLTFCGYISLSVLSGFSAGVNFSGNNLKVLEYAADKNTGLDKIYVAYGVEGLTASYRFSSSPEKFKWYRYSNLGGGYAEEIKDVEINNGEASVSTLTGDMGYIIEDGDQRFYFWLVDYIPHRFILKGVTPSPNQDCESMTFDIDGYGAPIHYYTINGQQKVLSRDIEVSFTSLNWKSDSKQFVTNNITEKFESLSSQMIVRPASLCETTYLISGDRFLKAWNWEVEEETDNIYPHAVSAYTEATQHTDESTESSNVIKTETTGLGGSAPVDISFVAYTSDGVIHNEWQMSGDADFANVTHRFTDQDLDYTFLDEGTFYIRYVGSNSDGSCDVYGDVYTVSIGSSELQCPNAFSPNGDGVNDIWKVSFRSLLDFKCWIFDRFGNEMYYFTDPQGGWDGTYKGKAVSSGVYYYVIQARGSDGKKYKKSGDINIITHRATSGGAAQQ